MVLLDFISCFMQNDIQNQTPLNIFSLCTHLLIKTWIFRLDIMTPWVDPLTSKYTEPLNWTIYLKQSDCRMLKLSPQVSLVLMMMITPPSTLSGTSSGCQFPSDWLGSWHHLGHDNPLNVSLSSIDTKVIFH